MSFTITLLSLFILFLLNKKYGFGSDYLVGEQKFHYHSVARTGGIAIFIGFFAGLYFENLDHINELFFPSLMLFIFTLVEDINGNLKPSTRFFLILLASSILVLFSNISIQNLEFQILNFITENPAINIIFTVLTISLVVNSYNIIDGFNGLVAGFCLIVLGSIIYLGINSPDIESLKFIDLFFWSVLAFFVLNFPFGKIFLGDSGAYFIGFITSYALISFVNLNPSISSWFALSTLMYPVFEVVFSIVRKKFFFGTRSFQPDQYHLHMLIYRNLINCKLFNRQEYCNSLTSIFLWVLSLTTVIPSIIWFDNSIALFIVCVSFMLFYIVFYILIYRKDIRK